MIECLSSALKYFQDEEIHGQLRLQRSLKLQAKKSREYKLFILYVQNDTATEAAMLYDAAKKKFPNDKIFRDSEAKFIRSGWTSQELKIVF